MPDEHGMRTIEEWQARLSPAQIRNAIYINGSTNLGVPLTLQDCLEMLYGDRKKVLDKYGLTNSGKKDSGERALIERDIAKAGMG